MPSLPLSRILAATLILCFASPSWSTEYNPSQVAQTTSPTPALSIRNAKQPFPGILTGGQPSSAQLSAAKRLGYKTVISLRARVETGLWNEGSTVEELGMKYVSIPVKGIAGLTAQNAKTLIQALADPADYPILLHCGSGDRVGALLAIDAGINQGIASQQALKVGRSAGLNRLEGAVKQLLEK
ncbi:MAG: hypothetical protein JKX83_04050 [Pseudomonadales bacterium]|nr:hypothetical protein [Pseudomonadales bacterium]